MVIFFPQEEDVDMRMVGIFSSNQSHVPHTFITSESKESALVVEDLYPFTSYIFRTRTHPKKAFARVWNWSNWSEPFSCVTSRPPILSTVDPHTIKRIGPLSESQIVIQWFASYAVENSKAKVMVKWWVNDINTSSPKSQLVSLKKGKNQFLLNNLSPGTRYYISVDGHHPIRFNTKPIDIEFLEVFRVSEETSDIDLLENHNSGDIVGEAAFLTDSGNFVMPISQLRKDKCAKALNLTTCGSKRGKACMSCLHAAWELSELIRSECSDPTASWPKDNKVANAFCKNGFGFFDWTKTPISRYCVARRKRNFAEYMSCNAPEADIVNNQHSNPVCICACYADRIIGQQSPNTIEMHCGKTNISTFIYPQCNCSRDSVLMPNNSESRTWIGSMEVKCPYFKALVPQSNYSGSVSCGRWFSHPRGGSCLSPDPSSPRMWDQGCSWKRDPKGYSILGTDLLQSGWNRSSSFDDKTGLRLDTTNQTLENAKVMQKAFEISERTGKVRPRCCGC